MSVPLHDVMTDVSYVLVEDVTSTTLGTAVAAPGVVTCTPPSMSGIYVGAQLMAGYGLASQETITVAAVSATTFAATFAKVHANTDPLVGATFPSSQQFSPDSPPLFTQAEILSYCADIQNEFLLKTECVYAVSTIPISANIRLYAQPATAIKLVRISIDGQFLWPTTQKNLDLEDPSWIASTAAAPSQWFNDEIDTAMFGFKEMPQVNGTATCWYSLRGPTTLSLTDSLTVPDVFAHWIKYGVLGRCFAKDGEMRDPMKADYCDRRMKYGIVLARKYMESVAVKIGDPRLQTRPLTFSRFPMPQEAQQTING